MRRPLLTLTGLIALVGLAIPPFFALSEKRRRSGRPEFDVTGDELDVATIFAGDDIRSQAAAFRGGDVLCWYGGLKLDLSGVTIDEDGAYLRVRCLFGGLDLVVPEGCPVHVRSRAIMGGVGDMTDQRDVAGPALVVDALSLFGGVSVRNPEEDERSADGLSAVAADGTEGGA